MVGFRIDSCNVSLRFFSPPDRSTFNGRSRNFSSKWMRAASVRNSVSRRPTSPSRPRPFNASDSTSFSRTPGTSVGYCITRCRPAAARCHVGTPSISRPSSRMEPAVTVYPGLPMTTADSVLLPAPFGPITACTSPDEMVRFTPCRICLSPTEA